MHREGINYPKFKDQFAAMDFETEPMPVLSLFPMLERDAPVRLGGPADERRGAAAAGLRACAARPAGPAPSRPHGLPDLQLGGAARRSRASGWWICWRPRASKAAESGFFAFYSKEGLYFEGLPRSIARDPRVLLVFGLNGRAAAQGIRGPAAPVGAIPAGVQEREVGAPDPRLPEGSGGHQAPAGAEQDGDPGP